MIKKYSLRALLLFFLVFPVFFCATAQAKSDNSNGNNGGNGIVDAYMTEFFGDSAADSFNPKDSFTRDETPWLYLKLQDSVDQVTGNWWFWNKGNQDWELSFNTRSLDPAVWEKRESDNPDGTKNLWLTRLDMSDFAAHDQWWHVNAIHSNNPNGGCSTKYHVTPEPASMLLYILGGGSLIAGFFRKRK
jgi:hypothetical protein